MHRTNEYLIPFNSYCILYIPELDVGQVAPAKDISAHLHQRFEIEEVSLPEVKIYRSIERLADDPAAVGNYSRYVGLSIDDAAQVFFGQRRLPKVFKRMEELPHIHILNI